jgi:hypothetical protein
LRYFKQRSFFIKLLVLKSLWQTLLAKWFVEGGHRDIEAFKALEKCFDQEHRGTFVHAKFMRAFSQRISTPPNHAADTDEKPLPSLSEEPSAMSTTSSEAGTESTSKRNTEQRENISGTSKGESKKKGKAGQIADRHPSRPRRSKGPPGNPPGSKETRTSASTATASSWEVSKLPASNDKLVFFVSLFLFPML